MCASALAIPSVNNSVINNPVLRHRLGTRVFSFRGEIAFVGRENVKNIQLAAQIC